LTKSEHVKDTGAQVELAVCADEQAVRAVHKECDTILREHDVADTVGDISQIVLAEVLNNIVEHAYAEDSDGEIDIQVRITEAHVEFRISDNGLPLPDGKLPGHEFPDIDVETANLPEGGFGWPLIHSLVEGLRFDRMGDKNTVSFYILR